MIEGLTTAATLWLATVIGLALGGGQLVLGVISTLIGLIVLWILKWIESRLRRQCRGKLSITAKLKGPLEVALRRRLQENNAIIRHNRVLIAEHGVRQFTFDLSLLRLTSNTETPPFVYEIADQEGVVEVNWESLQ
jgi:putative Mg2+ transporter-C (MgtC) family protein